MGSYKWSYKSPNMGSPLIWVITIVILLIILLITTHEPPSRSLLRTSSCAEKDLGLEMPKP